MELNQEQIEIATSIHKNVIVLAGPGTGKTRSIIARAYHIIHNNIASPSNIMIVTFTNKAAMQLKNRLQYSEVTVGTFHSIALKILMKHYALIGLRDSFRVIDDLEQFRILKQLSGKDKAFIKSAIQTISTWKDETIYNSQDPMCDIYNRYIEFLHNNNLIDFSDIIPLCNKLFDISPETLGLYHNQFKYLMVDEFQDVNHGQNIWVLHFAQKSNICCVGDDDQAIYEWRGANVGHLMNLHKSLQNHLTIVLKQTYRSTPEILKAASLLISYNKKRFTKSLNSTRAHGAPVKIITVSCEREEASFIVQKIIDFAKQSYSYSDFAILARVGAQFSVIEEHLLKASLPYALLGEMSFFDKPEIKNVINYIRLILNQHNDEYWRKAISFKNIKHTFQEKFFEKIMLLKGTNANERALIQLLDNVRELSVLSFHEMMQKIITIHSDNITIPEKLSNLQQLLKISESYECVTEFLDNFQNTTKEYDCINLMTLHMAKGTEFKIVFLIGWEEGLLPNIQSLREGKIEEERRLAYVGLTRAKDHVIITHAQKRWLYGYSTAMQSRFIKELQATEKISISHQGKNNFTIGKKVQHSRFGQGTVIAIDANICDVRFDNNDIKKIVHWFLSDMDV